MTGRARPVIGGRGVFAAAFAAAFAAGATVSCTTTSAPPVERFVVSRSWARIADSGATGGAYLDSVNHDTVPRSLVGITTDAALAAEVHETMTHEGMTHMTPRTDLPIAAGTTRTMQPGGVHVMLVDLRRALAVGDSVRLRLRFSDSTEVAAMVPVRAP